MFVDELTCETWLSSEESVVNGFAEGRRCWVATSTSSMEKCSKGSFGWLVVGAVGLLQLRRMLEGRVMKS